MAQQKKIIVACGSAIATSTAVAKNLGEEFKKRGIPVVIQQCRASEVENLAGDADLIVSTTPLNLETKVPVIVTLAFVTGVGREEVLEEIIGKLNN